MNGGYDQNSLDLFVADEKSRGSSARLTVD